ncbi:regulator of G-protein signaling 3 isoform X2 [Betta splendens]|uniref:Regulator of G-protein signaling 3 isoform X2 n=1 Tax=Betta splendens TaxID=158456 RepID=A0A6P7NTS9_BETSP|nr:regulator of G-protein signaling 3 isoform X2 [Betta splendens]
MERVNTCSSVVSGGKMASYSVNMRRFSSEGSLLDLDFLPWKTVALNNPGYNKKQESVSYTLEVKEDAIDGRPRESIDEAGRRELTKEHSVSVENICKLGKQDQNHLSVCSISEGCRAYSDSQLSAAAQGSTDSIEKCDLPLPSPSSPISPFPFKSHNRHHPRLAAAKLHLKNLFVQSNHSSNPNLFPTEHTDSAKERRSRLLFMRQWSQVGHSKKRRFSREELEKWAESLNALLASHTAVSVFGAFLRSEFSEENLQFYLACEQYKQSSNNFSLQRRAKNICTTYIQPGAPREVNLDSKTRDLTIQLLQAPSLTSLSHAQKRIYSLLDTDCYPRFLQSTIYLTLLREAD